MPPPRLESSALPSLSRVPRTGCIKSRFTRNLLASRQITRCTSSMTASPSKVQILRGVLELPSHYKAVLLDQFGVLHDGTNPYPDAIAAVLALADRGLKVLIVSNSSRRAEGVWPKLTRMGFPKDAFCGAITSGELAHRFLRERPSPVWQSWGQSCMHLTWGERGSISLEGLDLQVVENVREAGFILAHGTECLGRGDGREPVPVTAEEVRSLLQKAVKQHIPLLIANPDIVTVDQSDLRIMPGTFGRWYEEMGGQVVLLGKPAAIIYEGAMQLLGLTDPKEVVAIGDSLEHDIAGAQAAGCDSVFVAGGIHARDLGGVGPGKSVIQEDDLRVLCSQQGAQPTFAIPLFQP